MSYRLSKVWRLFTKSILHSFPTLFRTFSFPFSFPILLPITFSLPSQTLKPKRTVEALTKDPATTATTGAPATGDDLVQLLTRYVIHSAECRVFMLETWMHAFLSVILKMSSGFSALYEGQLFNCINCAMFKHIIFKVFFSWIW